MPDIFLIQPPIEDFYITTKRTIPYGLLCIASSLIKEGFSVEIFDSLATSKSHIIEIPKEFSYLKEYYGNPDISPFSLFHNFRHFGYSFEHIGKKALESGAFLVGISSLFTPYLDSALNTAIAVKKFYPKCKIVLGGHHPTAMPETVLECKEVDFVLRGEGEVSMPLLAKQIKNNSSIENIPGIAFRNDNNKIFISQPAFMKDLDDYPLPLSINFLKNSFYQRNKKQSIVIVASRGCPMKCSYCSLGADSFYAGGYRRRQVESIIKEIKSAKDYGPIGFIDFEDENISFDKNWFKKLLIEITNIFIDDDDKPELRAMNGLFPPSLDEEIICLMKKSGFKTLNLSLGSFSKKQLEKFNRPDIRDSFDKAISLSLKYNLNTVSYIIIGAPLQDPKDSLDDLIYLSKINTVIGVSVFYPSPLSPDFELCKELKILPDKFSLMRSTALPISHTTTRTESVTLLRLGRILNFMKHLSNDADLEHDRIKTGKKLLSKFLDDGEIRGIEPDGTIYNHIVSNDLTKLFLQFYGNCQLPQS